MASFEQPTPPESISAIADASPSVSVDSRWPKGLRSLGYKNFRLLWIGALISNIGGWMQITAQAWVVFKLSDDNPAMLGLDAFVAGVPVLLTPLGGVLADHVDRKKLISWLTMIQMVVSGFLAIMLWLGYLKVWHIIVCSGLSGILNTLTVPTIFAFMPDMVERKDLPNAMALNALQFNVSRLVGPVLGGVVLHQWGPASSFGLNALSFVAVLIALGMIHPQAGATPRAEGSAMDSLREAADYLKKRRDIVLMLLMVFVNGFFASPIFSMLPALCSEALNRDDSAAFTTLLSLFGLGAVVGATLMAIRSHHAPKPWRAFVFIFAIGVITSITGFLHNFHHAAFMILCAGMCIVGIMLRLSTAVSASIPASLRGRVSSLIFMAIGVGMPLGGLLAGIVARRFGVRVAFESFGASLLVVITSLFLFKQWAGIEFTPDISMSGVHTPEVAFANEEMKTELRADTRA